MKYEYRVTGTMFDSRVGLLPDDEVGGKLTWDTETDAVTIQGVDFGKNLEMHIANLSMVIVKVPGQQWYLNQYQGMQYAPAQFLVFEPIAKDRLLYHGSFEAKK